VAQGAAATTPFFRPGGDVTQVSPVRRNVGGGAAIAPHTEVRAGGRVVARATTELTAAPDGELLTIHVDCVSGGQPPWARRLLVHDLLNRAERAAITRILMVAPIGDTEILEVVREHCRDVTTRGAGSTCIVEARIHPSGRPT
jgi:hypothetical protein